MSGLLVLSGYVSGEETLSPPESDPRFSGFLSQSEILDLLDAERNGCQLTVSACPWALLDNAKRKLDCVIGEGEIEASGSDFRDRLDEEPAVESVQALTRIGRINIADLVPGSQSRIPLAEECDCDRGKGESCVVCCVKLAEESVRLLIRGRDGSSVVHDLTDREAQTLHLLTEHEVTLLHRKFSRNGLCAILEKH